MLALEILNGGYFTLSAQLRKPNYLVMFLYTTAPTPEQLVVILSTEMALIRI